MAILLMKVSNCNNSKSIQSNCEIQVRSRGEGQMAMTECRMEGQDGVGGIRTVDDGEEGGWKTRMSSHRVLDRPGMKEDVESDGSDEENESGIGNQVNIPTGELQSEIQQCIYRQGNVYRCHRECSQPAVT